jgi:dCTP deaminase
MILTDREIRIAVDQGLIKIDPAPGADAYSSTSVDLILDNAARSFHESIDPPIVIDPGARGFSYLSIAQLLTQQVDLTPQWPLKPRKLLLAWTKEVVELPATARVAARVEGKSSLARLGVGVHITAPTIHAGFKGQIQLEIVNHGPSDVVLRPGMKICQLIFEATLGTPEKGYAGIFSGQRAQ